MDLKGISMGGIGVNSSSPPTQPTNAKKKRRTNANSAAAQRAAAAAAAMKAVQDFKPKLTSQEKEDFVPPPLSGFGDTIVASNPFDDTPRGFSFPMQNGPRQMLPHHLSNPQMRSMNSMQGGSMNLMPRMGNPAMGGHINRMMSNPNGQSMGNINLMSGMRCNMPPAMAATYNHMNMNISHVMNSQMNGPSMNNSMNGMLNNSRGSSITSINSRHGSPMNGAVDSVINSMGPNHTGNNSTINGMNGGALSHNTPQSHMNQMNNSRGNLIRPQNIPSAGINSAIPGHMMGLNQMNNMNMMRSQINNVPNINMNNANNRNQFGLMGGPMSSVSNNVPGKSSGQVTNMQLGLQGPPLSGSRPMGLSGATEKVFPPDQPMVFNHQNPYAPPISPCGVCHKEVHANDQAIFCESGCNFWFHRRCTGLTEMAYDMIMNEPYAEWVCDKCIQTKNIPLVKIKP